MIDFDVAKNLCKGDTIWHNSKYDYLVEKVVSINEESRVVTIEFSDGADLLVISSDDEQWTSEPVTDGDASADESEEAQSWLIAMLKHCQEKVEELAEESLDENGKNYCNWEGYLKDAWSLTLATGIANGVFGRPEWMQIETLARQTERTAPFWSIDDIEPALNEAWDLLFKPARALSFADCQEKSEALANDYRANCDQSLYMIQRDEDEDSVESLMAEGQLDLLVKHHLPTVARMSIMTILHSFAGSGWLAHFLAVSEGKEINGQAGDVARYLREKDNLDASDGRALILAALAFCHTKGQGRIYGQIFKSSVPGVVPPASWCAFAGASRAGNTI